MSPGDIYWYTFRAPDQRRPVLILTRDSAIRFLTGITIAPITTRIRGIPSEVALTAADGLQSPCAANCVSLQTVSKSSLEAFITRLPQAKMREVRAAIEFALGFDTLA